MRLDEHADFRNIVSATADSLRNGGQPRIRDEHVEKDYWVTEVLRHCQVYLGDRALFKGGTSLSKGWGIIHRFSEDVDLAVSTIRDGVEMSRGQVRDDLRRLVGGIEGHPGMRRDESRRRVSDGARDEYFDYDRQVEGVLPSTVKLEVGTRSGQIPSVRRPIWSQVAIYMEHHSIVIGDVEVDSAFEMRLMDPRRTFVEKLFAIHSEVERYLAEDRNLGSSVRHYYDLYALASLDDIASFVGTDEHRQICADYERICREHFRSSRLPAEMCLKDSQALYPSPALEQDLRNRYQEQMSLLCFEADPPPFDAILALFSGMRSRI